MKKIRIALIGYGNVGKAFAQMLLRKQEYINETYGCEAVISAICTRSKGAVMDPEGIDVRTLRDEDFDQSQDALRVIDFGEYDIMAELTPINIMSGMPAIEHVRRAMNRGKHVITANKGPIAWAYRELRDLAREKNVQFCYEATVMDGVPVYNLTKETLMGCKITEVSGILNATTNFILTEMEKGSTFDEAVAEGRVQGFVEADASMDIDGWDAAAKLTALMNVLMDVSITPLDINRTGIGGITKSDLDAAADAGKKIKLLCRGWMTEDGSGNPKPVGTVGPTLVDRDSLPAIMDATSSYVSIMTDLMGGVTVIEEPFEPEIDHTAYGVLSDLLRILLTIRLT
ncbi:MAG: homoserine dehydrogenase [Bacillota bacterium]|nr:homoserine dehydrogenase [Bacillota bacterium]